MLGDILSVKCAIVDTTIDTMLFIANAFALSFIEENQLFQNPIFLP